MLDEEVNVNVKEAMRLCDALQETISLGPGVHNALFALPEARANIGTLWRGIVARDVHEQLAQVERAFDKWFTEREWRGHDQGESFQADLYSDIHKLKMSLQIWYSTRLPAHR